MSLRAEIAICGAGIAGISCAYQLSVNFGVKDILLIDERAPLTLTSDKSTECYRNWWPGPDDAMVALMNRSIDILEELATRTGNLFQLNRRGYLYLTANKDTVSKLIEQANISTRLGAGDLRVHESHAKNSNYRPSIKESYPSQLVGADLLLNPDLINHHYPYLLQDTIAALHVRRAGWLSAQQLGMYMFEQARINGTRFLKGEVIGVSTKGGRVNAIQLSGGNQIECHQFINAAGPYIKNIGLLLGIELPVFSELHLKAAFKDSSSIISRDAPLLVWKDPQMLSWTAEEASLLSESIETDWLLEEMPAGVHTRPEGGESSQIILMLWEYHTEEVEPVWPPRLDEKYPEIVLRGLARMIPALKSYIGGSFKPTLDGGYYTKTTENRPLIGPLPIEGAYICGALSGFGIMAACAVGELMALHITGRQLPKYARAFLLERYQDPIYQQLLNNWGELGQL